MTIRIAIQILVTVVKTLVVIAKVSLPLVLRTLVVLKATFALRLSSTSATQMVWMLLIKSTLEARAPSSIVTTYPPSLTTTLT